MSVIINMLAATLIFFLKNRLFSGAKDFFPKILISYFWLNF